MSYRWSAFTKPWKTLPGDEVGRVVAGLGFDGAEVPVREGAFVDPVNAERALPEFAERLRGHGVEPTSVASELDEPIFAACAAASVPLIRVVPELGPDGYAASVRRARELLEAVAPLAERYDVQVGVQPHFGPYVSTVPGAMDLLSGLPRERFRLVWDAAHGALAGEDPRVTLELAAERLAIVNLKNVRYVPVERDLEDVGGAWEPWFVPAAEGLANWSAAFEQLERMGWSGPVCLCGEYSDRDVPVEARLAVDLAAARGAARDC